MLYQKRVHTPGHAFAPDTPWQRELEESFPFEPTPDQRTAIDEVKADMELPVPMDRLVCGDVGFGKTEVALRAVFKAVQDGRQAAVLVPTTLLAQQHFQTFSDRFAGYPVRVEVLSRFLTTAQAKKVIEGVAVRRGRRGHRHPSPAVGRRRLQGPRPAGGRRGAALRGEPQGVDQAAAGRRRRAHADGHAHPAHARDEPHRHPRPDAAQHAAGRAPADPHLRRRVRRPGRGRGHPARAAARRPGVLRPQPGAGHRQGGSRGPRPGARGQGGHRPRADGRGQPRDRGARLLGGQVRRARVHHDHRVRHRHADGEHAGRRPGRPARARADAPAAGPGRPGRVAGLRLPVRAARQGAQRGGLRAAQDHRRGHRAGLGLQHRHARPRDPRRRQPARHRPVGPHRRGRLRPLLPDGHRGGGRAEGRGGPRAGRDQARAAARRQPAGGVRGQGGAAARGLPAPGRGHHRGRGRRHPGRVGGPLRPGSARSRGAARGGPPAGRVRAHRRAGGHRDQGPGLRRAPLHRPHRPGRAAGQQGRPPASALQGHRLQGGDRPAPAADQVGVGLGRHRDPRACRS